MAFSQTDIDTLKAAIASGRKRVRLNGREIEYQSTSQMQAALNIMKAEVGSADGAIRRPRAYITRVDRGL